MSLVVVLLLLLAGLSEAVGRILPLIARRPGVSRTFVVGLLATGALVDSAVFPLWPLGTWALAVLMLPALACLGQFCSPKLFCPGTSYLFTGSAGAPLPLSSRRASPMPGARPLTVPRRLTSFTWTASGNGAPATAGTAASWSRL
jgi:hypothetical protein